MGFSVETPLDMNSKSLWTSPRSTGKTRTPACPTTIDMPALDFGHRHAAGRTCARHVDDDAAIHFLIGDLDPLAADADFGPLIGRAVERLGKGAVHIGRHEPAILRGRADRAVVGDLGENLFEQFGRVGAAPRPAHSWDLAAPGRS